MSEHRIQNEGRNALAGLCLNFRVNVGQGWTGNREDTVRITRPTVMQLGPGDVVIRKARPFSTGLPPGFSDTFGLTPVVITPQMVGTTVGIFHAIEYKDENKKPTGPQRDFLQAILRNGGRAGVARSADEAVAIALGRNNT